MFIPSPVFARSLLFCSCRTLHSHGLQHAAPMDDDGFWDDVLDEMAADAAGSKSLRQRRLLREQAAAVAGSPTAGTVQRSRKKRKKEQCKRDPLNPDAPPGSVQQRRWDPENCTWWKLINLDGRYTGQGPQIHKIHCVSDPFPDTLDTQGICNQPINFRYTGYTCVSG